MSDAVAKKDMSTRLSRKRKLENVCDGIGCVSTSDEVKISPKKRRCTKTKINTAPREN